MAADKHHCWGSAPEVRVGWGFVPGGDVAGPGDAFDGYLCFTLEAAWGAVWFLVEDEVGNG